MCVNLIVCEPKVWLTSLIFTLVPKVLITTTLCEISSSAFPYTCHIEVVPPAPKPHPCFLKDSRIRQLNVTIVT